MTFYQLTGVLAQVFTLIIPIYIFFIKHKKFLSTSILVFFAFGSTLFYDYRIFNVVSLWQIMLVFISIKYFTMKRTQLDNKELIKLNNLSRINIVYFALVTFGFFYLGPQYNVLGGLAQNDLRPYVQVIQNALIFTSMIVVATLPSEKSEKILRGYFKAIFVFCIIGLAQGLIFQITGFDIFPMRKDFVSELHGVSVVGPTGWLRITAGIGEPKQFSKFLNIGLALVLLMPNYLRINRGRQLYVIVFLLAIIMTSSTTGYIIALFVLGLYYLKSSKRNYLIIIPGLLVLIALGFYIINSEVVSDKIVSATSERFEIVGLEDTDSAVVRFFIDKPQYLLTGVGISNAVSYANEYVPPILSYINNSPYTLRRGIIKVLAEGGIIGLFIYAGMFNLILRNVRRNKEIRYFVIFKIFLIMFLTIEAILPVSMLTLGLLLSMSNSPIEKEN